MLKGAAVWTKNKKIIALVDIVLIGKGIDGMVSWNSDIRHPVLPMHSELCIHPSYNFLEYALPFTIMASPVPTIFILISIQREKASKCSWHTCAMLLQPDACFYFIVSNQT